MSRPCTMGVGCEQAGVCYAEAHGEPNRCDRRPDEPVDGNAETWYRGWECGWNDMADSWGAEGWEAYKGGVDLDAPRVTAKTWDELLDAVDEAEGE